MTIEVLTNDPIFNTVVAEADRIALQSREEEKLRALLNAIQNCVLPNAPGSSVQVFFLRFLGELTPIHLQVLAMLNNPREWLRMRSIAEDRFNFCTVDSFIHECLPVIGAPAESCGHIVRGLQSRGLLQPHKADAVLRRNDLLMPRTTAMGRQFLGYIGKPPL